MMCLLHKQWPPWCTPRCALLNGDSSVPAGALLCSSGSSNPKAVRAAGEELVEEKKLALQCLSEQEK